MLCHGLWRHSPSWQGRHGVGSMMSLVILHLQSGSGEMKARAHVAFFLSSPWDDAPTFRVSLLFLGKPLETPSQHHLSHVSLVMLMQSS